MQSVKMRLPVVDEVEVEAIRQRVRAQVEVVMSVDDPAYSSVVEMMLAHVSHKAIEKFKMRCGLVSDIKPGVVKALQKQFSDWSVADYAGELARILASDLAVVVLSASAGCRNLSALERKLRQAVGGNGDLMDDVFRRVIDLTTFSIKRDYRVAMERGGYVTVRSFKDNAGVSYLTDGMVVTVDGREHPPGLYPYHSDIEKLDTGEIGGVVKFSKIKDLDQLVFEYRDGIVPKEVVSLAAWQCWVSRVRGAGVELNDQVSKADWLFGRVYRQHVDAMRAQLSVGMQVSMQLFGGPEHSAGRVVRIRPPVTRLTVTCVGFENHRFTSVDRVVVSSDSEADVVTMAFQRVGVVPTVASVDSLLLCGRVHSFKGKVVVLAPGVMAVRRGFTVGQVYTIMMLLRRLGNVVVVVPGGAMERDYVVNVRYSWSGMMACVDGSFELLQLLQRNLAFVSGEIDDNAACFGDMGASVFD